MKSFLPFLLFALLLSSCSEHGTDHDHDDDHDFITTIKLVVTDSVTEEISTYVWEDIDGPGGAAPGRIDTIRFKPGHAYTAEVSVLNSSVNPADDLTTAIIDEADEHQFFYTTDLPLTILYLDKDKNNKPLGQKIKINTSTEGGGPLTIELSHFDDPSDKNGVDPSDETDISVDFPVSIR
jgi:hypothetical protein